MKQLGENEKILSIIRHYGKDILSSEKYLPQHTFIQHGTITTAIHSAAVTYKSVEIALHSKKKVNMRVLIRAGLLHDYYLYDWHKNKNEHPLHGYTHAEVSMYNAGRDFGIGPATATAIYSHMFPLNLFRFPRTREARILCLADKICATYETLKLDKYGPGLSTLFPEEATISF